jgi:hypothetical protein
MFVFVCGPSVPTHEKFHSFIYNYSLLIIKLIIKSKQIDEWFKHLLTLLNVCEFQGRTLPLLLDESKFLRLPIFTFCPISPNTSSKRVVHRGAFLRHDQRVWYRRVVEFNEELLEPCGVLPEIRIRMVGAIFVKQGLPLKLPILVEVVPPP